VRRDDDVSGGDELSGTEPLERPRGLVDEEAEAAVLAAVLCDHEAYYDVAELLEPEDFAGVAHREIWRAVRSCESQGRPIDKLTVADELKRSNALGRVGGLVRLEDLVQRAGRLEHLVEHAEMVADRALARRVVHSSREIAKVATDPASTGDEALANAEREVFAISRSRTNAGVLTMDQAVPETLAELAKARSSLLVGHTTGFRELDRLTGGFQPGQMITLAARPGMGKSAMALSLARSMCESTGDTVVFLSYEMSVHELTTRLLASQLGCELHQLRQGQFPAEMEADLVAGAKRLEQLPLLLADDPPETISGVRALCRRLARRAPIAAVVIDYLQLMSGERRSRDENRATEVSEISRGAKKLARELGAPVVGLSQLNRQLESRPDRRPRLSDLRESGCLTGDTLVWRADTNTHVTMAELLVSNERDIPVWTVDDSMRLVVGNMTHVFPSGHKPVFELRLASGHTVRATANHPFLTAEGWCRLDELTVGDHVTVAPCAPDGTVVHDSNSLVEQRVTAITPSGSEDVFDATVEGTHNFVANGIVVHNSIEQDSDLVLFLYRDHVYNASSDPEACELIIGKQRSGPAGGAPVHLRFQGAMTRFSDRPQGWQPPVGRNGGQPF